MLIRRLTAEEALSNVRALAEILVDCVDGGASVSFMAPLSLERATAFWETVAADVARGARALLVAEEDGVVVGTVQLVLAMPENQPHRAEVAKMLVRRSARRRGIAHALMRQVEDVARGEGRTVLLLDTVTGSPAERLYAAAGWERVGDVPDFALMPDGALCSTTFFYKRLATSPAAR